MLIGVLEESELELEDFDSLEELSDFDVLEDERLDEVDEREDVVETEVLDELGRVGEWEVDEETLGTAIVVVLAIAWSILVHLFGTSSSYVLANPSVVCKHPIANVKVRGGTHAYAKSLVGRRTLAGCKSQLGRLCRRETSFWRDDPS